MNRKLQVASLAWHKIKTSRKMIDSNSNHHGRSALSQPAMSREAIQQAHIHAAQQLMARQQQRAAVSAAQYGVCYPATAACVTNEGLYSLMRPIHSSNNMELTGMSYQLPQLTLLNDHSSRSRSMIAPDIPPPQEATALHQAALLLQRNASIVSSEMVPQV